MGGLLKRSWGAVKEELFACGGLLGNASHHAKKFLQVHGNDPLAVLGGVFSGLGKIIKAVPLLGKLPAGIAIGFNLGDGSGGISPMRLRLSGCHA